MIFAPVNVFGATWEYITYGGFDSAVEAWKRVALIFSDHAFTGLFISAAVLGALFIYISTYARAAMGARPSFLGWTVPVLIGATFYIAMILPKDSLVIYDQTLNRGPYQVNNIPRGVATIAGLLNKITVGMTDIVSTSSDPASDYRTNAGGTGFKLLDHTLDTSSAFASLRASIARYIKDCVYFELQRPGTALDIDKISSGEQDYQTIIEEAKNPSVWTVYYAQGDSAGSTMTCQAAGTEILSVMNDPNTLSPILNQACGQLGYTGTNGLLQCRDTLMATLQTLNPNRTDINNHLKMVLFGNEFLNVIEQSSPTEAIRALATQQTMSSFIGLAAHAGTWIPVIRESLQAVAICLVPFLVLFTVTPLIGRAVSVIAGMFIWITVFSVIDAILHSFGMDMAQQASNMLKSGESIYLGLRNLYMFPEFTAKVAATFGAIRWAGLMLSAIITSMLVKFGGTALAMLAGSISSMPQSSGAAMGQEAATGFQGVLSGKVMPLQTWGNAAARAGGVGNLMSGLATAGAAEMSAKARVANELGYDTLEQGARGNMLGGIASGIAAKRAYDTYGLQAMTQANFVNIADAIGKGWTKQEIANRFFGGDVARAEQVMSKVEALQRYGMADAYRKGMISDQDLVDIGYYYMLAKAGDVDAMRAIERITGKNFRQVEAEIKQAGLEDQLAGALVSAQIANALGISRPEYFMQRHGVQNLVLNERMAKNLNKQMHDLGYKNFNAKAGDRVSIAFDPTSRKFGLAHTSRGGRTETYDFNSSTVGWEKIRKAHEHTEVGKHTTIHLGETDINVGTRINPGQYSDVFSAIVNNDLSGFHQRYSPLMWKNKETGTATVVSFGNKLEEFGDLKAELSKLMQVGYKVSPGGPLGKILSAAGVELYATGQIKSVDSFSAKKLQLELQNLYNQLYQRKDLSDLQKSTIFLDTMHGMYSLFSGKASQSTAQRITNSSMGTTPLPITELPDQNL